MSQQVATSGGPRSSSGKWRQVQDVTCTCSDLGQSWDAKNASFAAYARPRTAAATFAGKFAGLDSSGRASRSKIVRGLIVLSSFYAAAAPSNRSSLAAVPSAQRAKSLAQ